MRGSLLSLTSAVLFVAPLAAQFPETGPMPRTTLAAVYRLVGTTTNDHLYTVDRNELAVLTQQGTYSYEGVGFLGFTNPQPGLQPLYRFGRADGTHLLDTRPQAAADPSARREGVLCYIATTQLPGLVPLYGWVHPQLGLSFYTTHPRGEFAAGLGYQPLGVLGYVAPGQF